MRDFVFAVVSTGLVAGVFLLSAYRGQLPASLRRVADAGVFGTLGVLLAGLAYRTYTEIIQPQPWDFPHFYMVGRSAWEGRNFYDPAQLLAVFDVVNETAPVPATWTKEAGYWYTPPSALVLMPFGAFDYRTALTLHQVTQAGFLGGAALLMHRLTPLMPGAVGLAAVAVALLCFRPTISMIHFAQIVPGALLCLMFAADRLVRDDDRGSGLALALGFLFKHLMLIPAVFALFFRRAGVTVWMFVGLAASMGVALAVFGTETFAGFVRFGPAERDPWLAVNPVVQSLLATSYRAFGEIPSRSGALAAIVYPPYLIAATVLSVSTILVCLRPTQGQGHLLMKFMAVHVLGLLCYPNTLFNTLPLVVPAYFVLLSQAGALRVPVWAVTVFVSLQYAWTAMFPDKAAYAIIVTWAVLVAALASPRYGVGENESALAVGSLDSV